MFSRLGRGVNMRETLNRRWEQKHSQHFITHKVQIEANSQGMRNIQLEHLWRAIVVIEEQDDELVAKVGGSYFSNEIWEAPLPEEIVLSNIKTYEGKADPQDHLDHFNDIMESHMVSDLTKCRVFAITLSNGAKK